MTKSGFNRVLWKLSVYILEKNRDTYRTGEYIAEGAVDIVFDAKEMESLGYRNAEISKIKENLQRYSNTTNFKIVITNILKKFEEGGGLDTSENEEGMRLYRLSERLRLRLDGGKRVKMLNMMHAPKYGREKTENYKKRNGLL